MLKIVKFLFEGFEGGMGLGVIILFVNAEKPSFDIPNNHQILI